MWINMKDTFLKNLKKSLTEHQIQNADDVIDKYEKRFMLGHEAGMKDEEIIEAMDSIENIVSQYQNKNYDLYLDLTSFSDFEIDQRKNLNRPFLFDLDQDFFEDDEDEVQKYIQIEEGKNRISLKSIKKSKERLTGALFIEQNTEFEKVYIVTKSCDVYINMLKAKEIYIKNISGDFDIDMIDAKNIKIETISGNIDIDDLASKNVMLTSTSGDVSIGNLKGEEVLLSTVSGDIEIEQLDAGSGKISTVSGDIAYGVGNDQRNNIEITTVSGTIEEE